MRIRECNGGEIVGAKIGKRVASGEWRMANGEWRMANELDNLRTHSIA
jgi:hypothetical protein